MEYDLLKKLVNSIEKSILMDVARLRKEVVALSLENEVIRSYFLQLSNLGVKASKRITYETSLYHIPSKCNFCGREFKNRQAVRGHLKFCEEYIQNKLCKGNKS